MRASSEIIGATLIMAVTIVLGIAFLGLFVFSYEQMVAERSKTLEIAKLKSSVDLVIVYSRVQEGELSYVLEVINIGKESISFQIGFGVGREGQGYPVIRGDARGAYVLRGGDIIRPEDCHSLPPPRHCVPIEKRLSVAQLFTESEISLAELGSRGELRVREVTLPPKASATFYARFPDSPQDRPMVILILQLNNRQYYAAHQVLPIPSR
ncbi:MAG: hypothetical protein N3F67_02840 [Acidilobaceae archaeon]|nr:hypothetical protein [Acidilobaceae archaeon]